MHIKKKNCQEHELCLTLNLKFNDVMSLGSMATIQTMECKIKNPQMC